MSSSDFPTEPSNLKPESEEMILLRAVAADTAYVRETLVGALLRLTDVERRQGNTEAWIAQQQHPVPPRQLPNGRTQ